MQCPWTIFNVLFRKKVVPSPPKIEKYMKQLLSITPLEAILIGFVALGIFLFIRACWRNIQRGGQDQHNND